ncbi:hypothetical protein Bca101_069201 [Brassica carinata]
MSRYYNNMDNKDRCEFLVISIEQQHMWNLYLLSRVETVVSGFIALSPLKTSSVLLCLQIEECGDGSDTPLSAHWPGAPKKRPSRNIDAGFQRKLF